MILMNYLNHYILEHLNIYQVKKVQLAILINEHQYKANFRIDKEINATMSLISQFNK
jgi:hypothetical protein